MSNGHTPGPWLFHEGLGWCLVKAGNREVLKYMHSPDHENQANARLIAAAPELLEVLEDLLYAYCDPGNQGGDHDEKVEAARAAIAKARGA